MLGTSIKILLLLLILEYCYILGGFTPTSNIASYLCLLREKQLMGSYEYSAPLGGTLGRQS